MQTSNYISESKETSPDSVCWHPKSALFRMALFTGMTSKLFTLLFLCLMVIPSAVFGQEHRGKVANQMRLDQAHNGGVNEAPVSPVKWVNGNANGNNSHYMEGQSIPYRLVLGNVEPGTHEVIIGWDIRHGGKSAIDYITHYQRINETVNPLKGLAGSYSAPSYYPIPAPESNVIVSGNYQPLTSFMALSNDDRRMTAYNATITGISYAEEGDPTAAMDETRLKIQFTVTGDAKPVVFAWGGHIASIADWGAGNSASSINGSPYHTRFIGLDGQGGNMDRSLHVSAIIDAHQKCVIEGPGLVCVGSEQTYTLVTDAISPTFLWTVTGDATIIGLNNQSSVTIQASASGSYTVKVVITDFQNGVPCATACEKVVTVSESPVVNAGPDQNKCPDLKGTHFILDGSVSSGGASWSVVSGNASIANSNSLVTAVIVHGGSATLRLTSDRTNGCSPVSDDVVLTVDEVPACSIGLVSPSDLICNGGEYTISTSLDPALYDLHWVMEVDGAPVGWEIVGSETGQTLTFTAGNCGPLGFEVHFTLHVTDRATGCLSECSASFAPRAPLCVVDFRPPVDFNCLVSSQYLVVNYQTDVANPILQWAFNGVPFAQAPNDGDGIDSVLITEPGTYSFTVIDPALVHTRHNCEICFAEVVVEEDLDEPVCVINPLIPSDLVCNGGNYTLSTNLDPALYDFQWTLSVDGNPAGWAIIGSDNSQTLTFSAGTCGSTGFMVHVQLTVINVTNGCESVCEVHLAPRAPICVVDIRPPVELNCPTECQYLLANYQTDIVNPIFQWTRDGVLLSGNINDGVSLDSIQICEPGTYRFTISDASLPRHSCEVCFAEVVVTEDITTPPCEIGLLSPSDLICNGGNYTVATNLDPALYSFQWSLSVDGNPAGWAIVGDNDEQSLTFSAGACGSTGFMVHVELIVTDRSNGCTSVCEAHFAPRAPLCVVDIRPPVELNCITECQYLVANYQTDIINPIFEWSHNGVPIGSGINDGVSLDSILICEPGTYRFTIIDPALLTRFNRHECEICFAEVVVTEDIEEPACIIEDLPSDIICNGGNYSVSTSLDPALYNLDWSLSVDGNPSGWAIVGADDQQTLTFSAGACGSTGFQVHITLTVTDLSNGCVSVCDVHLAPRAPLCVVDIRPPVELNCITECQYLVANYQTDIINPIFQWSFNGVPIEGGINDGVSLDSILICEPGTYRFTIIDPALLANRHECEICFAEVVVTQDIEEPVCIIEDLPSDIICNGGNYSVSTPLDPALYDLDWSLSVDGNPSGWAIVGADDQQTLTFSAGMCGSTGFQVHITLTVTDLSNGCVSVCDVHLAPRAPICIVDIRPPVELNCPTTCQYLVANYQTDIINPIFQWSRDGVLLSGNINDGVSLDSILICEPGTYTFTISDPALPRHSCEVCFAQVVVTQDIEEPACIIENLPSDVMCNGGNYSVTTPLDPALYDLDWSLSVDGNPSGWAIVGADDQQTLTFSAGACGSTGFQVHITLTVTDLSNGCVSVCDVHLAPRAPICIVDIRPPVELNCPTTCQYLVANYQTDIINPIFEWSLNGVPISGGINDGVSLDSILVCEPGTYRFTIIDPALLNGRNRHECEVCFAEVVVTQDIEEPECVIGLVSPSDLICNHGNYTISTPINDAQFDLEWSMSVDGNPAGWAIIGSNDGSTLTFSSGDCGPVGFQVHFTLTVTDLSNGCVSVCEASFAPRAPLCIVDIRPADMFTCIDQSQYLLAIYQTDILNPVFEWTLNGVSLGAGINDGTGLDSILITEPGMYVFTVSDPANASNECSASIVVDEDILEPLCAISGNDPDCIALTNIYSGPAAPEGRAYAYSWSIDGNAVINGSTTGASVSVTATNACSSDYTLTLTVTDLLNGCTSTCQRTFSHNDNTAPVLSAAGADNTIICPASPVFTAPTATDDCDPEPEVIVVSDITVEGDCPGAYTRTITWMAIDNCGNESAKVSQSITVIDETAPVISAAGDDATIVCPGTPVFTAPTATDNCDPNPEVILVSEITTPGECPAEYSVTRTWIAVDDCGNESAQVTQTINVIDDIAPVISLECPPLQTIVCPAEPVFHSPTATDNCDPSPEVILVSDVTTPGVCVGSYTRTMTWIAVDDCGNESAPVSETITVIDNVAPVISAAGDDATIVCPGTPSFTAPTATDNCDPNPEIILVSEITTPGECPAEYSITRTWIAVDDCGNESAQVSQTITVTDDVAPVISAAGDDATIVCPGTPVFTAPTATDNCDPSPEIILVSEITTEGECPAEYSVTRTWIAVDNCGNESAQVTQTITVIDNVAPVISAAGDDATIVCPGTPVFTAPTATDNCDPNPEIILVSEITTPGECPAEYSITRTWIAVDDCGNESAQVTQTITVTDDVAPVLSAAGDDATIACPGTPSFTAPTATDNCDPNPEVILVSEITTPGECPAEYSVTRTWIAVDDCGNESAQVTQTINVIDDIAPVITLKCPAVQTIQCPAQPAFHSPHATDNCDPNPEIILVSEITTPGACPAEYSVTRTWIAVDDCGNESAPVSETITVIDNVAPVISAAGDDATIVCPGTPVFTAPTATDNCDPNPEIILVSEITTPGECPAEYSVTRTWIAVDDCGNESAQVTQTINVIDDIAPVISLECPPLQTIVCPAEPVFHSPTATDNCDPSPEVILVSDVTTPGVCVGSYTRTMTWIAVDDCGNESAPVSETITVIDNVAPVISAAGEDATIVCPGTPVFTAPTATDNCDPNPEIILVSEITTPGECPAEYSITRTWIAVDDCGNESAQVTQTITVTDDVAPVLSAAGDDATIACPGTPSFTAPTATDNCDPNPEVILVSEITTPGECPAEYSVTRTWIAVDDCGNESAQVTQTINVIDDIAPVVTLKCPAVQTIQCPAQPAFHSPHATDNCDPNPEIILVSDVTVEGDCPQAYTRTLTWIAVDDCGNESAPVTETIVVVDNTAPVISAAGDDATIACPGTPVFTAPTATDNCDPNPEIILVSEITTPGECPSEYSITRTWIAVDDCGNESAQVSQTITVTDDVAPVISAAGDNSTVSCPGTIEFTAPTATDNCDPNPEIILVSEITTDGECPGEYTITRTWIAVDDCGNESAQVSQTLNVVDNTAPVLSAAGDDATISCPGEPVFTAPTATDECDPTPDVIVVSDITTPGECPSEYSRTITWMAVDACGNESAPVSQTITVTDDVAPVIALTCPPHTTLQCPDEHPSHEPTATDNCDPAPEIILVSDVTVPGECPGAYTRTLTWIAVDDCGNASASVSETIQVIDNTAPVISAAGADMTLEICDERPVFTAPTATDICDPNPEVISLGIDSVVTNMTITYTQTWYAEDACGNVSAQVTQTIVVPVCHDQYCTLTQGFYGNKYGVACHTGELTLVMVQRLTSAPFGNLVIGVPGQSLTIDAAHSACITKRLPAGGAPSTLPEGNHVFGADCSNAIPVDANGKFTNVLLGQTIALALNLRVDSDLADLILEGNRMITAAADPGADGICGTEDDIELASQSTHIIPTSVLSALDNLYGSRSVNNLLDLANRALGGLPTDGASLSDINTAVTSINEGFNECRFLVGFENQNGPRVSVYQRRTVEEEPVTTVKEDVTVKAYPNPFSEEITIEFTSVNDGIVTVDVYDLTGTKVASIYNSDVAGGVVNTVKYNGNELPNGIYLILVKAGDKSYFERVVLSR